MAEKEYVIDDRVIIPDDIKKMTKEELDKEISRLEAEARKCRKANSREWLFDLLKIKRYAKARRFFYA